MPNNFLVIRIHPDSPVDGGTFGTYLDGLQIQVYPANAAQNPGTLLGETQVNVSDLTLSEVPWIPGTYVASVSKEVTQGTTQSGGNYGKTLGLEDGGGIAFGSIPVALDPSGNDLFGSNTTVNDIPTTNNPTVTLTQTIPNFVAEGTVVTFYYAYGPGSSDPHSPHINPTWGSNASFSFPNNTNAASSSSKTVNFAFTDGIAVGMEVSAASGIPANTHVTAVAPTSITVDNDVTLGNGDTVTFTQPLNSGIFQHVDQITFAGSTFYIPVPASVATAIIPIPAQAGYEDIAVVATRSGTSIPVEDAYYNVRVSSTTGSLPSTPEDCQNIPPEQTSLYITLPAPPTNAVNLVIPKDGSAPPFGTATPFPGTGLLGAMIQAVQNDPSYFPASTDLSKLSLQDCTRMAQDIVWSQQSNVLPAPPDPLESLYTNPPNPGGSNASNNGTNNLEQDRQKFEGTISSFYATRNATAQRLTKFVAAASAALSCEQISLNSTSALLEFPVDPASSFAASVESELLLQGVENNGPSGLSLGFGVPAAFFYALGATLHQSTTALQRFQLAIGDSIERIFQVFTTAIASLTISDSEAFATSTTNSITSFQAARRLVALGVSSASNSASMPVYQGTPLAKLVSDWLAQTEPTPTDPPLTYENTDFNIWSQILAVSDPTGYLMLDLDTLTQGYLIPPFMATVSPSQPTTAGQNTLTFLGTAIKIGPGMPVFGKNISPGTTVSSVRTVTTVTLSTAPTGPVTTPVTFNAGSSPITATPTSISGATLTFSGAPSVEGITKGMTVSGTNILSGTKVSADSATTTTVTLSAAVTGNVTSTDVLTFNYIVPPVTASTSADCPSGNVLTFASTPTIQQNMAVYGPSIPSGTLVQSFTATTVTLNGPVSGDLPAGSQITFLVVATELSDLVPVIASTMADTPSGNTLPVPTGGILAGMSVFGSGIAPGTTVQSLTTTSVTINPAVAGDVPKNAVLSFVPFGGPLVPLVSPLADQIAAWLPTTTTPPTPNPTVETLKAVTDSEWISFFTYTGNSSWLPPFTQPVAPGASPGQVTPKSGYVAMRIRAFIRAVQQFFSVSSVATAAQLPPIGAPPLFDLPVPSNDPILETVGYLSTITSSTFKFGTAITPANLATAVTDVFPNDPAAQAWLSEAITAINELFEVASVVDPVPGTPAWVSLPFSIVEGLYARGFRSAGDISRLSPTNFQQALTGTVAYDQAAKLHAQAKIVAPVPESVASGSGGSFQPINPDGTLLNCVPPPCLSPTGPVAYLHEMLNLSQDSTCENPFAPPGNGLSLGDVVSARRGPIGQLLASCANLETPLPSIDIVNECLEYLGTAPKIVSGTKYDTPEDQVAGYELCDEDCGKKSRDCHDPVAIFGALPAYSTPATPVKENAAVEPQVYDNLKVDFSTCDLPYSQALDVSRTYLTHFKSCRFEEMRTFRKCITEFALDPTNPPEGFQSFLWRYPVRIDVAIEYLGITPEEYTMLFQGSIPQTCGQSDDTRPLPSAPTIVVPGFSEVQVRQITERGVVPLPLFLSVACLSYCEFVDLSKCGMPVTLMNRQESDTGDRDGTSVPECEPCCLSDYQVQLLRDGRRAALTQLIVFIRLWRKLKLLCRARYTFAELFDICTALKLFNVGVLNREFIRQLAAFQMLRDQFHLPLYDPKDKTAGATGPDRTHILALWAGSGAKEWDWAKQQLLKGIEEHAPSCRVRASEREEQVAHLADNLDALSRLAGFNPGSTDVWNTNPACTLRFAEVLAKICASDFRISDLLYLFNAETQNCETPFPIQDADDVLAYPLEIPEDSGPYSLWKLREELLRVEICDDDWHHLTWAKIAAEFKDQFGYAPPAGQDPLLSLGQHFFPGAVEESGFSVSENQRQYRTLLTSGTTWNVPPGSPFQYDAGSKELWVQLPLSDEAVAAKLSSLPQLKPEEEAAVQDLYFAPRLDLAFVAFLFPDWQSAEIHLVQEPEERKRWHWFQRQFALANARRKVIAEHLAKHVAHRTGCCADDLNSVAGVVLAHLSSDENTGSPWDSDTGAPPSIMWTPPPAGGAIPALLGLVGTGLVGEYQIPAAADASAGAAAQIIWRDVRGPIQAFGHARDAANSPVPTVFPQLTLSNTTNPQIAVKNGYAVRTSDDERLGGAGSILVKWSGVLLVECDGEYRFHAGAPTPEGERPDFELAEKSQWRVTLQRGSKAFAVLNHQWPGNTEPEVHEPRLRRGAYGIVVEYSQPAPDVSSGYPHKTRTGFQVKYVGPDTGDRIVTLPVDRLYRDFQDITLDQGVTFLPNSKNAQAFLKAFYTSTLRDMRRTYQRAFKAVLFAGKLDLWARPRGDYQSELGYMLANPANFAGYAYYRTGPTVFTQHELNFDFDFLPVDDNYHPPAADGRNTPSLQQTQAMFDWWERLFDYTVVRKQVHRRCKDPLWHIFEEAQVNPPGDPAELLRHIGAEPSYWNLDLNYYQDQNTAIYSVKDMDLQDDRWLVRVWRSDRWIRCMMDCFHSTDISKARPDLWASDDPSVPVPASGVTQTGNANLLAFANNACFNEQPRRYSVIKRLNDGLRERGRKALVSYLCSSNRVQLPWSATAFATRPADLSDLLLLDVETGVCEKSSRVEQAITAVQTFVRRCLMGLEPNWTTGRSFERLWASRFQTYHIWKRCKTREIYRENLIEWTERGKARRIEAFRFLETELRNSTLTVLAPGGDDWWQDDFKSLEHQPKLIQKRVPSEIEPLIAPREGFATLGSPEYANEPTWLAAVSQSSGSSDGGGGTAPSDGGVSPAADGTAIDSAPVATVPKLAAAAAAGSSQPVALPLWMESAMKLGTRFLRVAAAGVPQSSLQFKPHDDEGANSACCRECGYDHPVFVDEYYFWLIDTEFYNYTDQTDAQSNPDVSFTGSYQFGFQDSYYDSFQQQSAEWQEEDQVPSLLAKWTPNRAVRLAWCRIHNGQFGQPRKSDDYVAVTSPADLAFMGRGGDSLYFMVTGDPPVPTGFDADPEPPGFRYDLPTDEAIGTPQAIKPPTPSTSQDPNGLLSYPLFAYHVPGARLFPESWFSPSMTVAEALRARCGFELALKWYRRAFDPLNRDCTWMICEGNTPDTGDTVPAPSGTPASVSSPAPGQGNAVSACCDSSKVTDEVARHRAVVLEYCHTLTEWGDALMRRRSPEAFQQAKLIFETAARITGCTPKTILLPEPASPSTVTAFVPANPPLNPRLMDLYSLIADRLGLIRTCQDARRLRNGRPDCDMPYWGDDPLRDGWRITPETCAWETEWCHRGSPYRFLSQIQNAIELGGRVREQGAELLSAYEKGDAEALASIRAGQERDLLTLGVTIRQDQWRDADWQVQALQQTKEVNQTNLLYYTNLYNAGLINNEIQNIDLSNNAILAHTAANVVAAIAEVFHPIPDANVGALSSFVTLPTGEKLAFLFEAMGKIMQTVADIQSMTAGIDLTQANWERRSVDWFNHMQTLPIEIRQIELQILGAQRRRDQALQELNNQQRQIENATEVLDFLRDKFTATDLYLFLQKETSALYRKMYEMALRAANVAQRAFNFERGHTTRRFIPEEMWDNLHDGLMAGERLDFALRQMEKAYLDENVREYELTKRFSMRYHFPIEFLKLRENGCCEIKIPEWMFDFDYPGQYMRRIKNVSLTIPCVANPNGGVHCRMTLLSSVTRIDPRLELPASRCCCECGSGHDYDACPHDPRMVRLYAATEAIATSSGQNDSGLFNFREFRDDRERYVPFEYQGAVSHWRIELPHDNNYFDMDTLSDLLINMDYISREGGSILRRAAMEAARRHLPGDGWCFFDARHEFPDAWQMLRNSYRENGCEPRLELRMERKMFPFVPGSEEISISRIAVLFHASGHECDCPKTSDRPCQCGREADCHVLEFTHRHAPDGHRRKENIIRIPCVRSEEWADLYYTVFETTTGPLGKRDTCPDIEFKFPSAVGKVGAVYLLCQYEREIKPWGCEAVSTDLE
jgi:hypothetical protein